MSQGHAPETPDMPFGGPTMKVYIAGPMTGLPDFNYPAFHAAAAALRVKYPYREFMNPAENYDGRTDLPRSTYLRAALAQVMKAEAVIVLPDWWQSEGALLEVKVARSLGIPIYTFNGEELLPLGDSPVISWFVEFPEGEHDHDALEEEPVVSEKLRDFLEQTPDLDVTPITQVAHDLVFGDRGASYGHPASDFEAMGRISGAILERWLDSLGLTVCNGDGDEVLFPDIEPRIVALIQTAVKLSREAANPKRDNRVDGIGYWLCADRIVEGY